MEGIRKDVTVACTCLLRTDWYIRQLIRRPVREYDAAKGPAIYRGREWKKPSGPPLHMTIEEVAAIPPAIELREPHIFRKGAIEATIQPQLLLNADIVVFRMIADAFPDRPIYFSRTSGRYAEQLGLGKYLVQQGLVRKLVPQAVTAGKDTIRVNGGWLDVARSDSLWRDVYMGPEALMRRNGWVDRASLGIPYLYIATAGTLAEAEARTGHEEEAKEIADTARKIAKATGLEELLGPS